MTNSRRKGKEGELEVVNLLRQYGFKARRGQQFKGGGDSPDVVHDLEIDGVPVHLEVKRREQFNLHQALRQAADDAHLNEVPAVVHRRNGETWMVTLDFVDFMKVACGGAKQD